MVKKKSKKKQDKKPRRKNFINELETQTYEQQILENNRQLARLRTRNDILEVEAEKLKETLSELEENKAHLTSYLQEVLDKKTAEATELQQRFKALERQRKEEQIAYKKNEDFKELEYKTMVNSLSAEIKLAAGKLNALEEWRLARVDLMNKFEIQEKTIAEQEIRLKETLYETEKKLIIGKANMQADVEKRLSELAESFRTATSLRLTDATQRAIRENVSLHQEMNEQLSHCTNLEMMLQNAKDNEFSLRLKASLHEVEAQLAFKKILKQNQLIKQLVNEQKQMCIDICEAEKSAYFTSLTDASLQEFKNFIATSEKMARILEQNIQLSKQSKKKVLIEARDYYLEMQTLENILGKAKDIIENALKVHVQAKIKKSKVDSVSSMSIEGSSQEEEDDDDSYSSDQDESKNNLLESLFEILGKERHETVEQESLKQQEFERMDNVYQLGNLGLIPSSKISEIQLKSKDKLKAHCKKERENETLTTTSEHTLTFTECSCD